MQVHVLVTVCQGVPDGVQVFEDKQEADLADLKARKELGIETDAEAESEYGVEVFYNVPVTFRERG